MYTLVLKGNVCKDMKLSCHVKLVLKNAPGHFPKDCVECCVCSDSNKFFSFIFNIELLFPISYLSTSDKCPFSWLLITLKLVSIGISKLYEGNMRWYTFFIIHVRTSNFWTEAISVKMFLNILRISAPNVLKMLNR